MKTPTIIGIVLILIAIISLSIGGFSVTKREKVVDLGPLQVSADKKTNYPIPPLVGYALLAGGIVLVAVGALGKKA